MGKLINGVTPVSTPESVSAYVKRGLENDFVELAKESKDKAFQIAHICMLHLMTHYILCDEKHKMTPKEAFERAVRNKTVNETMVKTLVTQFSTRGEEFGDWVENPESWETLWELEQ